MTKKISQTYSDSHLNFSNLPIKELSQILRRLALKLLDELLAPPYSPGKSLPVKPHLQLANLLTRQDINLLMQAHIWQFKRTKTRKTGRIPGHLRDILNLALKKMMTHSIKGKLKFHQWQKAANNRLALIYSGTKGNIIPDDSWPLAAQMAWLDPDFRLAIALRIKDWLQKTRLFMPTQLPVAIFSPNTFWVFIALTKAKPKKLRYWFLKKERNLYRICQRLQKQAQMQIMKNNWAGFWDQWIIQLTTQRWPSAFKLIENRTCKALLELPLLKTTANSSLCPKKAILGINPWTWVEKWFDKLDGIKYLKDSKKDIRKFQLFHFADPEWEQQMPVFFTPVSKHPYIPQ